MSIRFVLAKINSLFVKRILTVMFGVMLVGGLFIYATRDMSTIHVSVGKFINFDDVHSLQVSNILGQPSSIIEVTETVEDKVQTVIKKLHDNGKVAVQQSKTKLMDAVAQILCAKVYRIGSYRPFVKTLT